MQNAYQQFQNRMKQKPGKVHFIGIGGVGMAGLAYLMKQRGWDVSGCDAVESPMLAWLSSKGILVEQGNSEDHLDALRPKQDLVIRTPAVPMTAPSLREAMSRGFTIIDRGVALAAWSLHFDTLAVCGTHGKTTTSCFLAGVLRALMPEQTSWIIGGISSELGAVAGGPVLDANASKGYLVAEADESDGTLRLYTPKVTILTNIDLDHMEHFHGVSDLENTFREVLDRTTGTIVYCADHPRARAIGMERQRTAPAISYGFAPKADYRILDAVCEATGSTFVLQSPTGETAQIHLRLPGTHNVLNATAAVVGACAVGVPFESACVAIEQTAVLPARRFESIGAPDGFQVISDYSHHPVEIAALVETAKKLPHQRIVAIFQPHRYSRTQTLLRSFPGAFEGIDELVLCPVYCASEPPICGGEASDLYAAFRAEAVGNVQVPLPVLSRSVADASEYVRAIVRRGDVVLVIGAGDVNSIAPEIAATVPNEAPPSMLRIGAYGTESLAKDFVAVRSMEALFEALKSQPFDLIGAGTNTFLSPTGAHHKLIHLSGPYFNSATVVHETLDAVILEVGPALQGPTLLRYCVDHGYSGIEFMAGIPGQCGGWLAMNAGTRYGTFCDAVVDVDVVEPDGTQHVMTIEELAPTYRACVGIRGRVAVRIRIRLLKVFPQDVRKAMDEALEKRIDLSGIRSAGSVFKNPPAPLPPAGVLLERAGCKGLRIGGAHVSASHANIVASEPDATPSDIYALMHMMRERALATTGVLLEPEVRFIH